MSNPENTSLPSSTATEFFAPKVEKQQPPTQSSTVLAPWLFRQLSAPTFRVTKVDESFEEPGSSDGYAENRFRRAITDVAMEHIVADLEARRINNLQRICQLHRDDCQVCSTSFVSVGPQCSSALPQDQVEGEVSCARCRGEVDKRKDKMIAEMPVQETQSTVAASNLSGDDRSAQSKTDAPSAVVDTQSLEGAPVDKETAFAHGGISAQTARYGAQEAATEFQTSSTGVVDVPERVMKKEVPPSSMRMDLNLKAAATTTSAAMAAAKLEAAPARRKGPMRKQTGEAKCRGRIVVVMVIAIMAVGISFSPLKAYKEKLTIMPSQLFFIENIRASLIFIIKDTLGAKIPTAGPSLELIQCSSRESNTHIMTQANKESEQETAAAEATSTHEAYSANNFTKPKNAEDEEKTVPFSAANLVEEGGNASTLRVYSSFHQGAADLQENRTTLSKLKANHSDTLEQDAIHHQKEQLAAIKQQKFIGEGRNDVQNRNEGAMQQQEKGREAIKHQKFTEEGYSDVQNSNEGAMQQQEKEKEAVAGYSLVQANVEKAVRDVKIAVVVIGCCSVLLSLLASTAIAASILNRWHFPFQEASDDMSLSDAQESPLSTDMEFEAQSSSIRVDQMIDPGSSSHAAVMPPLAVMGSYIELVQMSPGKLTPIRRSSRIHSLNISSPAHGA